MVIYDRVAKVAVIFFVNRRVLSIGVNNVSPQEALITHCIYSGGHIISTDVTIIKGLFSVINRLSSKKELTDRFTYV